MEHLTCTVLHLPLSFSFLKLMLHLSMESFLILFRGSTALKSFFFFFTAELLNTDKIRIMRPSCTISEPQQLPSADNLQQDGMSVGQES